MSYDVSPVSVLEAVRDWPLVEPYLKRGVESSDDTLMSLDDLFHGIQSGRMALWKIHDDLRLVGAFVTEYVSGENGSALNVIVLGGTGMDDWIGVFSNAVAAHAKEHSCRYVVEMGRHGWDRVLSRHGWERGPLVMLKKVA